jgi:hypothetical protein
MASSLVCPLIPSTEATGLSSSLSCRSTNQISNKILLEKKSKDFTGNMASSIRSLLTSHIKKLSNHQRKKSLNATMSKDCNTSTSNDNKRMIKKNNGLAWRIEHDIETDKKFNPSQIKH